MQDWDTGPEPSDEEISDHLRFMNQLGGAMRMPIANHRSVWDGVHRKITRPVGGLLLLAGSALWAALVFIAWWRPELSMERIAVTGIESGLLFLTIGIAHEQYREWKSDRYKDLRANAVIGVRFTTSTVMSGAAEIMSYGTAVTLKEEP
jgi:hypothetical protein